MPVGVKATNHTKPAARFCCCSEMFGANYFILSQTNPRVVPLLNARRAWGTAGQLAEAELKHRCGWWWWWRPCCFSREPVKPEP
jgi:hypothetical protein